MLVEHLISVTTIIFTFVSLLFLLSIIIKRNDIADVAWGIGIFIVAIISYQVGPQDNFSLLITTMAGLWGMRLSIRILLRNLKKAEDFRYKVWRDSWGKWFYFRSYLQVYLLQGFLMILVGYPFIHASTYGADYNSGLFYIGVFLWMVGYFFETVSDYQLDKFLSQSTNKGQIMDRGLWRYSRHPNYFGEVTMWWGIWFTVLSLPYGLFALVSPLTITFLILKVSGIPLLEKSLAGNPAFQAYKEKTNAFFPFFPKK